jgi:hypothetical protein
MRVNALTGKPIPRRRSRPKSKISDAEHTDRVRRVRSIDCSNCGAPAMHACPGNGRSCTARWNAWYARQEGREQVNTGRDLLQKLQEMADREDPDLDLPISLEGCDCAGLWSGAIQVGEGVDDFTVLELERIDY